MKAKEKLPCIFERVFIETPVDTDGDGKLDLIAACIRRPAFTTEKAGERVPAIFVANPYLMTCNEDWYNLYDVNQEVKAYPAQKIKEEDIRFDFNAPVAAEPTYYRETQGFADTAIVAEDVEFEAISDLYAYLNDKGYASVFCGGLGTRGSEGYTLSGSREEILAFKAVIDWLNGRCRAFTNKTDNIEIKASWCTGNVAMSAKSYLGTMCIGVAATGVEGLKTIIPEAGISNWYHYYRMGGLVSPPLEWQGDDIDLLARYCFSRAKDEADYAACKDGYQAALARMIAEKDRDSGNYNRFWDARNYLNQIENFKASVFIIHGLNDWNVKTNQCLPLFQALEKQGVERKMLLHQGEHIYVYDLEHCPALPLIERWLDHYLRGADNGIEREPKVLVESNTDQSQWMTSESWPPAGWQYVKLSAADAQEKPTEKIFGQQAVIVDDLGATVYDRAADNQQEWRDELVLSEAETYRNRMKLTFAMEALTERAGCTPEGKTGAMRVQQGCTLKNGDLRIAGTIRVSFEAAIDRPTAILSAMLVELGEDRRITREEVKTGAAEPALKETFRFGLESTPSAYKVISRGHLNAQNRTCLWRKEEIIPGQKYRYEIEMVPTDHTVKADHKLGLLLYGIDAELTLRPQTVTQITVDTKTIVAEIPVVCQK